MSYNPVDIEKDVKAAIVELTTGEKPAAEAGAPAPVAETPPVDGKTPAEGETPEVVAEEAKTAAKPRDGETEEARGARLEAEGRNRDGTFKAKAEGDKGKAAKDGKAAPAKADGKKEGEDAPLVPPSHWPVEAKAEFANAPRKIQEQILAREKAMDDGRKEWGGKAEDYNRIDKVIGPHRDRWLRDGKTPDVAIGQLLAAEKALQSDPVGGVVYLLKTYKPGGEMSVIQEIADANGYTLTKKATNQGGTPAEGAPASVQVDPTVRRQLDEQAKEIAALRKRDEDRENAIKLSSVETLRAAVKAVETDPKNLYFANLREEIAALVDIAERKGDKRDPKVIVQEAYDNAVYSNPQTRALQEQQNAAAREAAAKKAAADKVAAARKASGSINGAPADGAAVARSGGSTGSSIEAAVRQAAAELASRA